MHKSFLAIASILAALSVALGAFGAHGLKQIVNVLEQWPLRLNCIESNEFCWPARYRDYHAVWRTVLHCGLDLHVDCSPYRNNQICITNVEHRVFVERG